MTPRQLQTLAELHQQRDGGGSAAPRSGPQRASTQGGAGWLMAVSSSLERNRPGVRVNAPPMFAPGVG